MNNSSRGSLTSACLSYEQKQTLRRGDKPAAGHRHQGIVMVLLTAHMWVYCEVMRNKSHWQHCTALISVKSMKHCINNHLHQRYCLSALSLCFSSLTVRHKTYINHSTLLMTFFYKDIFSAILVLKNVLQSSLNLAHNIL